MSKRRTYNPVQSDVAWQRQLRDQYAEDGLPPGLTETDLNLKTAQVRAVPRSVAQQIILKYEWLGTMSNTRYHFGLFFKQYCAGVTCVAAGTGTGGVNTAKGLGLKPSELGILARGACVHWSPKGSNSKLVSWTARLLRHSGLQMLLAYADTDAGEIGTIYQACNWLYIGRGNSVVQFVSPNGHVYDQKLVYNVRKQHGIGNAVSWTEQRDALLAQGWTTQKTNPKHRYACIINPDNTALVERLKAMQQPYPKRG